MRDFLGGVGMMLVGLLLIVGVLYGVAWLVANWPK